MFHECKLQCIQNGETRIVTNTCRYTSITPVLKKLCWLPVEYHSLFKTTILVNKFLYSGFPKHFDPYVLSYSSSYSTRCSTKFHPCTLNSAK